jgi:hypothetical protein
MLTKPYFHLESDLRAESAISKFEYVYATRIGCPDRSPSGPLQYSYFKRWISIFSNRLHHVPGILLFNHPEKTFDRGGRTSLLLPCRITTVERHQLVGIQRSFESCKTNFVPSTTTNQQYVSPLSGDHFSTTL